MMKVRKILFSLFLIISVLFASTVEAAVSAPSSFTMIGNDTYVPMIYGKNFLPSGVSTTLHFRYKRNSSNQIVYCTEADDGIVSGGNKETYSRGTKTSDRVLYVLINGLNGTASTSTYKQADYFATGIAVWYVLDSTNYHVSNFNVSNGTYKGKSNDVTKKVASLVNDSIGYTYKDPTISAKSKTATLTLTSDEKNYMTGNLGVKTTGYVGNYTVSLKDAPTGTVVVDTSGNAKSTFAVGSSFKIKVPASSIDSLTTSFTVNISATGTEYAAYNYIAAVSSHQNLVTLYKNTKTVSTSMTVNLNLSNKVEISKTDATTGDELPGATLKLAGPNNYSETWESTTTPKVFEDLDPGEYTLTETNAPEGYIKNTETIKFTINTAGKLVGGPVIMENIPKAKVPISKKDATTGKELPGATLKLTGPNNYSETWVSTTTPKILEDLGPGKYTLTETIAPEGYIRNTETVNFTIDDNGQLVGKPVTMMNIPKSYVYISKQDITTGEELPGAMLVLKDKDGNEIDSWTSGTYPHRVKEKLSAGTYTLSETIAPEGYIKSTETVTFIVNEDGGTDEAVIMYNKPEKVPENPPTGSTFLYSLMIAFVSFAVSLYFYADYKLKEKRK